MTDKPFAARIVEARPQKDNTGEKTALILDETIFYPEGGGQPGDRGTINGCALIDIQEKEGELLHIVSAGQDKRLAPGPAELILDAVRRRDFTVQHTAQHLLSGILFRLTGYNTVSMHLGDEINTIDFGCPDLSADVLFTAEETAAQAIEQDNPIKVHLCPPEDINHFPLRKIPPRGEDVIRVIEIQGVDFVSCCGTHCGSTGQIGMMRVLGAEKYKGMTRISFIAGRRVLRHHRMLHENAALISRSLSVPLNEIGNGTLALIDKANAFEWQIHRMEDAAAETKARSLMEKAGSRAQDRQTVLVESFRGESVDELLRIGKALQKSSESVFILASETELKFIAVCSVKGYDIRPLFAGAFEKANGKGGGGPSYFQGRFAAKEDLLAFLAEVRPRV